MGMNWQTPTWKPWPVCHPTSKAIQNLEKCHAWRTINRNLESNSISSVWSTGLCKPHQGLSTNLVKSIFDNLFGLIFYPPPPFDPAVQRTAYGMVLAGMKSVMNRNYDVEYGYLDESVFKPCMACACRKLLSDDQLLHTLLLSAYCTDPPATEMIMMLENVWNIIPSLRPGFTKKSASIWINGALSESRALRLRLSNSNIELDFVDVTSTDSVDTPVCKAENHHSSSEWSEHWTNYLSSNFRPHGP